MARKQRSSTLESRTARLKLAPRGKPYPGPRVARGAKGNYRRVKIGNGSWVGKIADGHGKYREVKIADADDFGESNGRDILTFFEMQDALKKLLRGEDGSAEVVLNLDKALTDYKADLKARDAHQYNAELVRYHLSGNPLLRKPLSLITADELKAWRNSLIAKGLAASTVNRVRNNMRACLELAMPSRSHVWKEGLETLPNATRARKLIFPDKTISALVAEAYRRDAKLGLLCDVLAITGMRPVQAQRLRIEDLITDAKRPRLMVSKTAKGGGRNRAEKKLQRYPVPITAALAVTLKDAAKGRPDDARLLLRSNGKPWSEENPNGDYRDDFAEVVKAVGLAADSTAYLFRHSSIVRNLLRGMHTKIVADTHDTSEQMIRQHYGKYIVEHSDEIIRAALLHHDATDNVIKLAS